MRKSLSSFARLARTAQYLRLGQISNRLSRNCFASSLRLDGPTPPLRAPSAPWIACTGRAACLTGDGRFSFMGIIEGTEEKDIWNDKSLPKLWLYHLHYFEDLLAEGALTRQTLHHRLIARWIDENPPICGNGWEPYPLSRRIVNWICFSLQGNHLDDRVLASLARQARALRGSVEYHLMGNHLFANAKALVFAGCFFAGAEAENWLRFGLTILHEQISEQLLGDGGHFELSPMYHALILEDMIDLQQLSQIFPNQLVGASRGHRWQDRIISMLIWLGKMTHPDGHIAFFNDSNFGQARTYADLLRHAENFAPVLRTGALAAPPLGESGYVRLENDRFCVFFDAAEVGASYIPGHAHADTLSIEVSLDDERFITNGGTSTYANGLLRETERATASHATVEIDEENSSETWASFRVGRRAFPKDASVALVPELQTASASHDGYRFLPGKPAHARHLSLSKDQLIVRDALSGSGRHQAVGRFPLHPSVKNVEEYGKGWQVTTAGGRIVQISIDGPVARRVENGFFANGFGLRQERRVLTWRAEAELPMEIITEFRI
jgi:uncharacterized heparinase superfamily protein